MDKKEQYVKIVDPEGQLLLDVNPKFALIDGVSLETILGNHQRTIKRTGILD